jgi:hypothetical protein
MQWRTDEPPINTEIEYERDNGVVVQGRLAYAGEFGIGNIAASGKHMRRKFTDRNGPDLFEVVRWRALGAL